MKCSTQFQNVQKRLKRLCFPFANATDQFYASKMSENLKKVPHPSRSGGQGDGMSCNAQMRPQKLVAKLPKTEEGGGWQPVVWIPSFEKVYKIFGKQML